MFNRYLGPSYLTNSRRSGRQDIRERERERERERIDRERERMERDHYDREHLEREHQMRQHAWRTSSEEMEYNTRGHLNTIPATTHIRHTNEDSELMHDRDDRYPLTTQSSHMSSSRRDRTADDYSPHRGGGSNRRVLNAI